MVVPGGVAVSYERGTPVLSGVPVGVDEREERAHFPRGVFGLSARLPRFRVHSSGFRVQGSGFRVQGSRFRVQGSGFRPSARLARAQRESDSFLHSLLNSFERNTYERKCANTYQRKCANTYERECAGRFYPEDSGCRCTGLSGSRVL